MSDLPTNADADTGRGTTGGLAERLTERVRGNVGVVDVRHVERQYDGVVGWVAGRFGLLGLLAARYGTMEARGGGSAAPPLHAPGSYVRGQAGVPSAAESTPAAESATKVEAHGGTNVIQRKAAAPAEGGARTGSGVSTESDMSTGAVAPVPLYAAPAAPAAPFAEASPLTPWETPEAPPTGEADAQRPAGEAIVRPTSTPDEQSRLAAPTGRPSDSAASDVGHVAAEPLLSVPESVTLVHAAPEAGARPTLMLQRLKSSEPERTDAAPGAESPVLAPRLATADPGTHAAAVEHDPGAPAESVPAVGAVESLPQARTEETQGGEARRAEGLTSPLLPLVAARPGPSRLYREEIQRTPLAVVTATPASVVTPTPASEGVGVRPGPATATEQTHARLKAPEVPARPLSFSGARMIWRKSSGVAPGVGEARAGQTGLSASSTLYRTEAPADFPVQRADAGTVSPPEPARPGTGGIDLEQITEHVSRVIMRRIAVERERRGIGKWV
jgi:hypothetical protein